MVENFPESGRYEFGPGRYFRFAESKTESPQVGYAVFVGIGEIVEVQHGVMDWKTPVRVRLQGLNEYLWTVSDVFDTSLSIIPKFVRAVVYREHGLVVFNSGVIESKLEDALVERGAKIVNDFTQSNRKVERNSNVQVEVVDVLREVRLYRTANSIGAGLRKDVLRLKVGQDLRLVIRPLDFQQDSPNRGTVRFSDVD